ncbi:MAG: HEAT repeat domain-containing protein [Planctomycetota bacterium]
MSILILLLTAFQAPAPAASDWPDPATAARYYEALHALEVDDQPARAADLFSKLAAGLPPEARQARAIAAAQAARAAMAAGQETKAESLQTEARSLARAKPFEDRIRTILAQGAAARPAPAETDADFRALIETLLRKDDYAQVLPRYGRRIVPYLVAIVSQIPVPLQAGGEKKRDFSPQARALEIWSRVATLDSVPQVEEGLKKWETEDYARWGQEIVWSFSPQDERAHKALDRLLLDLVKDQDLWRAQWAATGIAQQLGVVGETELLDGALEILMTPGDPLAPFLVGLMPEGIHSGPKHGYLEFWRKVAHAEDPLVAARARFNLIRLGDFETLVGLAKNGSADDRLRLAVLFGGWDPYGSSGNVGINFRIGGNGYRELGKPPPFDVEQYGPMLLRLLDDADPTVRRVAASVAAAGDFVPAWKKALESSDSDVRRIVVSGVVKERNSDGYFPVLQRVPKELDQDLFRILEDPAVGEKVLKFLGKWGVGLSLEQLHRVDERLGDKETVDRKVFQEWCKTQEGKEKTDRWIQSPDSNIVSRQRALDTLVNVDPSYSFLGVDLFDPEKNMSWNSAFINTAFFKWLPFLKEQLLAGKTLGEQDNTRLLKLAAHLKKLDAENLEKTFWEFLAASLKAGFPGVEGFVKELASSKEYASWTYIGLSKASPSKVNGKELVDLWLFFRDKLSLGEVAPWASAWFYRANPDSRRFLPVSLESEEPSLLEDAFDILEVQPQAASAVVKRLQLLLKKPRWASKAARALVGGANDKDLVPALLEAWNLPGLANRPLFVYALGETLDDRVVHVLLDALADPDGQVASAAEIALKRFRTVREQRQAFEAWQLVGGGLSPVAALLKKLQNPKVEVRVAAIRSLGTLQAKEALPFLVDLLEDPNAEIAAAARKALARINGAEATSGGKK